MDIDWLYYLCYYLDKQVNDCLWKQMKEVSVWKVNMQH